MIFKKTTEQIVDLIWRKHLWFKVTEWAPLGDRMFNKFFLQTGAMNKLKAHNQPKQQTKSATRCNCTNH